MAAASTASRPFTPCFLHGHHARGRRHRARVAVVVAAAAGAGPDAEPAAAGQGQGRKKTVDTRIHWSDPDEGWIGGKAKKDAGDGGSGDDGGAREPLGGRFANLINNHSESHYQFLGVAPDADMEEIKAAYRRLSKEYHPDTTTLPLKAASERFIRLREAYLVLGEDSSRRFYDWTLAQEGESRRLTQLQSRLEDPYETDVQEYESVPDLVDRLGGKNIKLSDQAMTALSFDIGVIIFCILCLIYVLFFKEQY